MEFSKNASVIVLKGQYSAETGRLVGPVGTSDVEVFLTLRGFSIITSLANLQPYLKRTKSTLKG